jgi:hypothetical protein
MMSQMLMGSATAAGGGGGGGGGGGMVVSISPSFLYKTRAGAGSITSDAATASVINGTGPFTYAWTRVSGDSFTINAASSAATTFTTTLGTGQMKEGIYRCTVTDSLAASAFADATAIFEETA